MKKLLVLTLVVLCLAAVGCSRNMPKGPLPQAAIEHEAATVHVLRSTDGVFWALMPLNITVDGYIVARLGTGQYVRFTLDYGFHDVGISDQIMQFPFEKGKTYYFLAQPDDSSFGFGLTRLDDTRALKLMQTYKNVTLNQQN